MNYLMEYWTEQHCSGLFFGLRYILYKVANSKTIKEVLFEKILRSIQK